MLPHGRVLLRPSDSEVSIIYPQKHSRSHADGGYSPPDAFGLVGDLSEVMHERSAEPAADQRSNANGQECETHVGALLSRRGKERNVFVVARLLRDLAE